MKIVVAGCGKVGATIVEQLSAEGHEISIIDSDPDIVDLITNKNDVIGVVGNSASYEVQKEAGIEDADLLVAATDSDEVNMLCCLIAKKAGDCKTIARVRNPLYHREIRYIKDELGLSMAINPEMSAAREISRILRSPEAMNIETFARGRVELTEFVVPEDSALVGEKVMDIRKRFKSPVLICVVERGEEVFIPNGSFVLEAKDIVNFVATPQDARGFFKEVGLEGHKIKKVMIVGGGTIAYYLTKNLIGMGIKVKIIEKSKTRCEELSELVPEAIIINGDAKNEDILKEEGIEECDAFVSMTGMDEVNIFLSLEAYALNKNCKIITKANNYAYETILGRLNLGSMVYPKYMTAEGIVRYVRAMENGMGSNVETLYRIVRNKVEAMEFLIKEDSPIDIPLFDLPIKDDVLIAAVIRRGEIIYPNGRTQFKVGDRVVVVTTLKGLDDINKILIEP